MNALTNPRPRIKGLAASHSIDLVSLVLERYSRASEGMRPWAELARKSFDYVEGEQWDEEAKAILREQGRPNLTFNHIAPLVRLVLGFHSENRTEPQFIPQSSGQDIEATAKALQHLFQMLDAHGGMRYVDEEVFMDGIIGGRGFFDTRLSFDDNDYGEVMTRALDPFSVFLADEATSYDLREHPYLLTSRWVDAEEAHVSFGDAVGRMIVSRHGNTIPISDGNEHFDMDEIAPWRRFGGEDKNPIGTFNEHLGDNFDPHRKSVRLIDMQHTIRVRRKHFIDLDTGEKEAVPDAWGASKVKSVLEWYQDRNRPIIVDERIDRRVRWTIMCGDMIVHDEWSPYDQYTIQGFFPYFRRGRTRGMVEDLISPQDEINKRRSDQSNIVSRTANSGWMFKDSALDEDQQRNLEEFGARAGVIIKYKGDEAPKKIDPSPPPMAMERLEQKAIDDLRRISGINESLLGELDRVQSGVAIQRRQRQSVMGLQMYLTNFDRTKELLTECRLGVVQRYYTEKRLIRMRGIDGNTLMMTINEKMPDGTIANDVTMGRFAIEIAEAPASKSFMEDQFAQVLEMMEKGLIPPEAADLVFEISGLPNKEKFKERIQMVLQAKGLPIGGAGAGAPAGAPQEPAGAPVAGAGAPQAPMPPAGGELSTETLQRLLGGQ